MLLESFALAMYLAVSSERTNALAIVGGIFALQFGIMLIVRSILRRGTDDDDEPGSDGGGPRRRRGPVPRRPPPAGPVCWPEFEAQFAEYVAGLGTVPARQPAGERPSPGSDDVARTERPDDEPTPSPRGVPVAKPMSFYAGVDDDSADAALDHDATKALHHSAEQHAVA